MSILQALKIILKTYIEALQHQQRKSRVFINFCKFLIKNL